MRVRATLTVITIGDLLPYCDLNNPTIYFSKPEWTFTNGHWKQQTSTSAQVDGIAGVFASQKHLPANKSETQMETIRDLVK